MLIHWGKKLRRSPCGSMTAFCPICRLVTQHRVVAVSRVSHIYFIPLGNGTPLVDEGTCQTCGTLFGAAAGSMRATRKAATDVESGLRALLPEELDRLTMRLGIEEQIARGQLTPEQRMHLIMEPFRLLEYGFHRRASGGNREKLIGLSIAVWLLGTLAAIVMWAQPPSPGGMSAGSMQAMAAAGAGLAAAGLGATLYLVVTRVRHSASGVLLDRLVMSLLPLRPTESELRDAMEHLRASKCAFAASVRLDRLLQRLA